jgi:formate-dependent nitrite reductase cytochrome c552 subunit
MGVTIPKDYCYQCHEDIAENRESHRGMGFETCSTAGCHNYHDNKALYEDFLVKHAQESDVKEVMSFLKRSPKTKEDMSKTLTVADADFARHGVVPDEYLLNEWHHSSHAQQGVSCSDCHDQDGVWTPKPTHMSCQKCHQGEVKTFLQGRHGMRLAEGLSPMSPSMARQPMHKNAGHKSLSCVSCHGSHDFDREEASVKACMSCHNDEHTNQYLNSKHFDLWADKGLEGGVSCATCHMPRLEDPEKGYVVQHNQNANLRPNEKMIREVCMDCHGLAFSIDALADPKLVKRNFIGVPSEHIKSIDMATERD